jgi:hypothetical protein
MKAIKRKKHLHPQIGSMLVVNSATIIGPIVPATAPKVLPIVVRIPE